MLIKCSVGIITCHSGLFKYLICIELAFCYSLLADTLGKCNTFIHKLLFVRIDDFSKQFLEALDEERTNAKPYFSTVIKDVEVVEGSAARFDCKIEGNFSNPEVLMLYISRTMTIL